MKQYQRKIEEYKSLIQKEYIRETAVHTVKERCSDIMNRQDNRRASYFEFLFEQFKFIKKRWWVLQGGILILLWILLVDSDGRMGRHQVRVQPAGLLVDGIDQVLGGRRPAQREHKDKREQPQQLFHQETSSDSIAPFTPQMIDATANP